MNIYVFQDYSPGLLNLTKLTKSCLLLFLATDLVGPHIPIPPLMRVNMSSCLSNFLNNPLHTLCVRGPVRNLHGGVHKLPDVLGGQGAGEGRFSDAFTPVNQVFETFALHVDDRSLPVPHIHVPKLLIFISFSPDLTNLLNCKVSFSLT